MQTVANGDIPYIPASPTTDRQPKMKLQSHCPSLGCEVATGVLGEVFTCWLAVTWCQSLDASPAPPRSRKALLPSHGSQSAMPSCVERERTQQRRALRLLVDAPEGMTEALMMTHGFNSELLVDLCIAGLAIAKVECMIAGGRRVEVVRMKITEAARQALTASRGKST